MRGGTKLYNLGARKLSPAHTDALDRGTLLGTTSPSDGDNKMLSPGGVSPSHSPTEMEYYCSSRRKNNYWRRRTQAQA